MGLYEKLLIMDRSSCMMCEVLQGKLYCQYYDVAVMLCEEVLLGDCPEGLDDDEYEDNSVEDSIYGNRDEEEDAFNREQYG
jgi:hypothetical protein